MWHGGEWSVLLRSVLGALFWAAALPYLLFVMRKRPRGDKVSLNRVGWPLLGSFRRVESDWHQRHAAMRGDVFSSSMKSEKVVVLNSEAAIGEAFGEMRRSGGSSEHLKEEKSSFFTHGPNSGVQESLANCNFDLESIEWKIKLELRHFLNLVEGYHGCQLDFDKIMDRSAANLACLLVTGRAYQYGENELMTFIALLNETSRHACAEDSHALQKALDICRKEIASHRQTFSEESIRDYIDENLKEMRIDGVGSDDEAFSRALVDLIIAATEAVSSSVMWAMFALAAHPRLKARLLQEVDDAQFSEPPGLAHRMPYVRAFVRELLRWKTVVPVSAVRRAPCSLTVGDFTVRQGEGVVANFWAPTHDPERWEEPLALRPDRFLGEDGALLPAGRCPGECVIESEVFLYVASLLQTFDVCFLPGVAPDAEREAVLLNRPRNFEICMPRRRQFKRQFS